MSRNDRVKYLVQLGEQIDQILAESKPQIFKAAELENPWFTEENIRNAFKGIRGWLDEKKLNAFINGYPEINAAVKVGIVMAGNIPMVGFHDFLCVFLSGHRPVVKLSSQDSILMKWLLERLSLIVPDWNLRVFVQNQLKSIDAVIATGSDNTNRYFQSYFGHLPNILRHNRTSIAIVNEDVSEGELAGLGLDLFSYFGLGCRNVSKVFFPENFDPSMISPMAFGYEGLTQHNKYGNNYDYRKASYLVGQQPFLDGGDFLWMKSGELFSPISVIYYSKYQSITDLEEEFRSLDGKLQCIIGREGHPFVEVGFGKSQSPDLADFADGVDTMNFLSAL